MAKIAVTDGMSDKAVKLLEDNGHEVVREFIELDDLLAGALSNFDGVIVRSATKLTKEVIQSSVGLEEQESELTTLTYNSQENVEFL